MVFNNNGREDISPKPTKFDDYVSWFTSFYTSSITNIENNNNKFVKFFVKLLFFKRPAPTIDKLFRKKKLFTSFLIS